MKVTGEKVHFEFEIKLNNFVLENESKTADMIIIHLIRLKIVQVESAPTCLMSMQMIGVVLLVWISISVSRSCAKLLSLATDSVLHLTGVGFGPGHSICRVLLTWCILAAGFGRG